MVFASLFTLFPILLFSYGVNAHGVLTTISGANGVTAQGFGVIASTPRDGGLPIPFEVSDSFPFERREMPLTVGFAILARYVCHSTERDLER